ncbi:16S rRNA (uracil(1498)-N(3))-methyltransferase [Alkaliphilus sp. B6464]|uniref:16S rRNA (uracil(1498)-N(3))-methyltransferase n=1 Tax=Alkaliphilus sp. B6464 TaxID=2731219 RepID=UPI001BAB2F96|nr:16S rRNA (uracil(1498)-N(3))-methyltransferase [Alkaliphilus sp. B6464]QUH21116.1 16S rRNA (uracil(1498)-N(3))-methyltransferase [Alkaliphilus sp. B6464]
MHRFFVTSDQIDLIQKQIVIKDEDVKHISKVLRLKEEDIVEICDGVNNEYVCKIESINKNDVLLSIIDNRKSAKESPIEVVLYQGIPKSTKMDLIIQKTTELGITEIIPVEMERTIVQFNNDKDKEKKVDRWQKIALEAAKQSKRGIVPSIHLPLSFKEAIEHSKENELNIMPYENQDDKGFKSVIASLSEEAKLSIKKVGIWIGPEGGFDEGEVTQAIENQIYPITLGPRILRTETAGFTILSLVMYELGDLGGA